MGSALSTELHRYELGAVLGTGATGRVLAAEREHDRAKVAVKTLKPELAHDGGLARRLLREAEAGRAVHHPGVLTTLDEGRLSDGSPFVVFERLAGQSLLAVLRETGPLSASEAALLGRRLAQVLSAVHAAGYVHRDVKPEHVVLGVTGVELAVHLIDFGICQGPQDDPDDALRERAQVLGTPGYLSPEQVLGDGPVDGRSDLYALGATLFEGLTGQRAFSGANPAVLMRRVLEESAPQLARLRTDLPEPLAALVGQLMSRDAAERPQNARSVARALAPFVGDTAEAGLIARLRRARVSEKAARGGDQHPTLRIGRLTAA